MKNKLESIFRIVTIFIVAAALSLIFQTMFWGYPSSDKVDNQLREEGLPWVENSLTQPLPANASKTRLSLPAEFDDLMPSGTPITGFGAHVGQHAEALDHVWISVKRGVPAKSFGDGIVTDICSHSDDEYFVYLDYGDGLVCAFGEISKPLVVKGQKVKHLDPIGEVHQFGSFDAGEIEVYMADLNRNDGIVPTAGWDMGTGVSPFDYLNDIDKARLEEAYVEKVINPYLRGKNNYGDMWHPTDPFLTNKIMVRERGKIIGEWFMINKEWNEEDISMVIFLPGNNIYHKGNAARLRGENAYLHAHTFIDGTFEVKYEGGRAKVVITTGGRYRMTYYALCEITEDVGVDSAGAKRARMKVELSESPIHKFSNKALMYQERGVYNPRYDAWKMGNWVKYR